MEQTNKPQGIMAFKSQEIVGYIFPIGACCLKCITKEERAKAEADTGAHAFMPIRWNIPLSDGEIVCDRCEIVLQEL